MKPEVNILLLGFAPFEKITFESFFKLAGRRDTLYKVVADAAKAHVLLVNGDSAIAVQMARESVKAPQKALYIGAPDPAGKWPGAPRPIKLTTVLGLLDVLVLAPKLPEQDVSAQAIVRAPANTPAPSLTPFYAPVRRVDSTVMTEPMRVLAATHLPELHTPARRTKGSVRDGVGRSNSDFGLSNFMGLPTTAKSAPKIANEAYDDILVVDDSDVALKFMQNRVTRYGFRAELAKSGEEALTRMADEKFKFVFLDVMMDGLDGYQTCRAIKQRKYASGKTPIVIMLTSRGGSIDKIRGGLAGCDAYLTKPLNEAELLKVLAKYDEQVERSFRDTNLGGSDMSSLRSHK